MPRQRRGRCALAERVERLENDQFAGGDGGGQNFGMLRCELLLAVLHFGEREIGAQVRIGQFEHDDGAQTVEIDTQPDGPRFEVGQRRCAVVDQLEDEFFPIALLALQLADQLRLFEDHLGGDAHQFAELAHRVRFAGESDHTASLAAHG